MRELTTEEMAKVLKAAMSALPDGAQDNDIVIIVSAWTNRGVWMNRISNVAGKAANAILKRWIKSRDTFDGVGYPNRN